MRKIFILMILLGMSFMVFAELELETKNYDFLSWSQPAGMKEIPENPWNGLGYYTGELDTDYSFIADGLAFLAIVDERLGKDMISDVKDDPTTLLEVEEEIEISGLKVLKLAGSVDVGEEGKENPEFEIYYFKGPFNGKQEVILLFLRREPTEEMALNEFSGIIIDTLVFEENALLVPEKYKDLNYEHDIDFYYDTLYTGEKFYVDYEKDSMNENDIIGIYTPEASVNEAVSWDYAPSDYGSVYLDVPDIPGEYELRMYTGEDRKLTAIQESIEVLEGVTPVIWLDKDTFKPGETIYIHYTVSPGFLDYGWVGLVNPNVAHGDESENSYNAMDYAYLYDGTEGVAEMVAPNLPGLWELRLNYNGIEYDFQSIEIVSDKGPVGEFGVTIQSYYDEYLAYDDLTVDYSSTSTNVKDWIGLYEEGANDRDYIAWQYTDGYSEGTLYFEGVSEGKYDFRMFTNDSFDKIGQSDVFEVTLPEPFLIIDSEFCRSIDDNYDPVESDYTFDMELDEHVYLWLKFGPFENAHYVTWDWISPDGEYFDEVSLDLPESDTPGLSWEDYRAWAWLNMEEIPENMKGVWFVEVYIDYDLYLVRQFEIK